MIRAARPDDADAIAAIYAPHVVGGTATFELAPPDAATIAARMASSGGRLPWLVWDDGTESGGAAEGGGAGGGAVLGYAYAGAYNARAAYRWTVETTIYLADAGRGRGLGARLYGELLAELTRRGFAQAVALISRPNPGSERLHAALGFRHAGTIARAGYKHGRWIDVGHWQRALADPDDPPAEPGGHDGPRSIDAEATTAFGKRLQADRSDG